MSWKSRVSLGMSVLLVEIVDPSTGKLGCNRLHWGRKMVVTEFSSTGQINPSI